MAEEFLKAVGDMIINGVKQSSAQFERWKEYTDPENFQGEKSETHKAADAALYKDMPEDIYEKFYGPNALSPLEIQKAAEAQLGMKSVEIPKKSDNTLENDHPLNRNLPSSRRGGGWC